MRRPYDLNLIPIQQIEAVEIYHGATTPMQYLDECGAVVIWTG